jgi:hypothetical protein
MIKPNETLPDEYILRCFKEYVISRGLSGVNFEPRYKGHYNVFWRDWQHSFKLDGRLKSLTDDELLIIARRVPLETYI